MKAQALSDLKPEQFELYKRIFLIGGVDVGKSYFIKELANFYCEKQKCLVVDLDVGQSDIGPVGCIGAVGVEKAVASFRELEPSFLFFSGFSSPGEDLISFVVGLRKTAMFVKSSGAQKVVFDTTGWVQDYTAFQLKLLKVELFKPDLVILIGENVWDWGKFFETMGISVLRVEPSRYVVKKDPARRRINRYQVTVSFFENTQVFKVDLNSFVVWGRYFKDLNRRLLGFYDRFLNTVALGWIIDVRDGEIYARVKQVTKRKPVFVKIGSRIDLD